MISIIKKPLVTEKNTMHAELKTYVFRVDIESNKIEIKNAIEKLFRVKVANVRTAICRDRKRRVGKTLSKVSYWKKAIVKLKDGQKIDIFEGA